MPIATNVVVNAVLSRILASESVTDGVITLPLRHPDFPSLPVHVDRDEGEFIARIVRSIDARTTLEIGMAYGVSTLFICDALTDLGPEATHIVVDPFQSTQWRGIGLRHVKEAGYESLLEFHEDRSEYVLPRLAEADRTIDFALIDGWHTFDQVLLEFYYIDRLLRAGGVVVFDDADRRSVNRVIRYALNYPSYQLFQAGHASGRSWLGALRRGVTRVPAIRRIVRADLVRRDWDLGISGSCVALRKVRDEQRSSGWYRDF